MDIVGYKNIELVYEAAQNGRLGKPSKDGGVLTYDLALNFLTYMALNVYDWPPVGKLKALNRPCRYYTLGDRSFIVASGMAYLPEMTDLDSVGQLHGLQQKRYNSAVTRVKRARRFLVEQGLLKQLEAPTIRVGEKSQTVSNGGYLLLLGDDEENKAVEQWARRCLNLG